MAEKPNVIVDKSFQFALDIIALYPKLTAQKEFVLSKQLLKAATSIGANVEEAIGAASKKNFKHKMNVSLKEARESRYWLRLLDKSELVSLNFNDYLSNVEELIKILSAIVKSSS